GELVVAPGDEPSVACSIVVFVVAARVAVVGIRMTAALKVRRERMCRLRHSIAIQIRKARLFAVCAGHPAEVMIEGSVLHHHHNDVLDPRFRWRWKRSRRLRQHPFRARDERSGGRQFGNELSTRNDMFTFWLAVMILIVLLG